MSKLTKNHCLKCKQLFTVKRNPNQQYCSQGTCQNTRKSEWHKAKRSNDPDYQHNHNAACKNWREQNKGYCRKYRDANPKYAQRNRQLQRDRDCRRAREYPKPSGQILHLSSIFNLVALMTKVFGKNLALHLILSKTPIKLKIYIRYLLLLQGQQ